MITLSEKIASRLMSVSEEDARDAVNLWALQKGMHEILEPVSVEHGALMTSDGREVLWIGAEPMALTREVHNQRRSEAIEQAKQREAERRAMHDAGVRESMAALPCPQMHNGKPCLGTLNRSGVCPSCATGRMGYKYRYQCDTCGFDIVTRRALE